MWLKQVLGRGWGLLSRLCGRLRSSPGLSVRRHWLVENRRKHVMQNAPITNTSERCESLGSAHWDMRWKNRSGQERSAPVSGCRHHLLRPVRDFRILDFR